MDMIILSENTKTGFIDFRSTYNAFKAYITNISTMKLSILTFKWKIIDSSGNILDDV